MRGQSVWSRVSGHGTQEKGQRSLRESGGTVGLTYAQMGSRGLGKLPGPGLCPQQVGLLMEMPGLNQGLRGGSEG